MKQRIWHVVFGSNARAFDVGAKTVNGAVRRACAMSKQRNKRAGTSRDLRWMTSPNSVTSVELLAEED